MTKALYYVSPTVILALALAISGYLLQGMTWAAWSGLAGVVAGVLIVVVPEVVWRG
jgi:drug/metabolite transporter (DMT)-like permease